MTWTVRACGGCRGEGAHSRRCRTRPGWFWIRLQDQAEDLADMIGSNEPECANMAYAIAARMGERAREKEREADEVPVASGVIEGMCHARDLWEEANGTAT